MTLYWRMVIKPSIGNPNIDPYHNGWVSNPLPNWVDELSPIIGKQVVFTPFIYHSYRVVRHTPDPRSSTPLKGVPRCPRPIAGPKARARPRVHWTRLPARSMNPRIVQQKICAKIRVASPRWKIIPKQTFIHFIPKMGWETYKMTPITSCKKGAKLTPLSKGVGFPSYTLFVKAVYRGYNFHLWLWGTHLVTNMKTTGDQRKNTEQTTFVRGI